MDAAASITVQVTQEDFVAFNSYAYFVKHRSVYRRTIITGIGAYLLLMAALAILLSLYVDDFIRLIPLAIATLIVLPFLPRLIRKGMLKNFRRVIKLADPNSGLLGEKTFTIEEDGFRERTAYGEQLTRWEGIHEIVEQAEHLFVFIDSISAHVIPTRAFENDAQQQSFVQALRQHVEKHGPPVFPY